LDYRLFWPGELNLAPQLVLGRVHAR
jgi:hypothetical protein